MMKGPAGVDLSSQAPLRSAVTDETANEIQHYSKRYACLFDEIRSDLGQLRTTGVIGRASELSDATGQHFNHNEYPHFFFGDLDASTVLVQLNFKQDSNRAPEFQSDVPVSSFEEYFDAHRHFGARNYGPESPRTWRSGFDHKQIRFLRPFDVIDFVEEPHKSDRFTNLERVMDKKLQLELVPHGSTSFSSSGFSDAILRPHYDRIMRIITARPRDYVIFCGSVFSTLLRPYVVDEPTFQLQNRDGTLERQASRFANLRLPYDGRTIEAGLASSWARQGIPMSSYGQEVQRRYG